MNNVKIVSSPLPVPLLSSNDHKDEIFRFDY